MKLMIAGLLMLGSVSVYAQKSEMMQKHEEKMKAMLEEHKTRTLSDLDKRIASLQEERTCIAAVTDQNGMRACREKASANHAKMREEHQQRRAEDIDKRMKQLEEEKQKLMNKSK